MISRSASRRLRLVGARGCEGWIRQIDTMYLTYSSYIRWEFRIISRYGNLFDRVRISLQWFLGVAVIRDRANKTRLSGSLWLSQAEYINKMDRFVRNGAEDSQNPHDSSGVGSIRRRSNIRRDHQSSTDDRFNLPSSTAFED